MPKEPASIDTLLAALERLTLWERFVAVASADQQSTVKKLLDHADALLTRVVETFPTYTLHDRTHAINVASVMGRLAEPWIAQMDALEAGLLLLGAFWHDVGMVFTEEERATIATTEEFQAFLRTHPEARLEIEEAGGLTRGVTEWFCRWSHAERVFHHLGPLDDLLQWDGIPLRVQLGNLCRSHNLDAAELKRDDLAPTDFLGAADVRFCAVLLRLADILDFDRTRSPDAIYRYLGIGRRADARHEQSDVEWRKHLDSRGFSFPAAAERVTSYPLTFVASPDEPAVEWDVRQFLAVIEGELMACQQLLRACSPRWRDVVLPARIDRQFYGKNYQFGDYRFLLEQEQVLGLLMGESLYDSPYVFVRELLQNALDTSRHREFHERAGGNAGFRCDPIEVSEWYDQEHYHWVRFDDFGMGMTEEIVRNFLLKVGRSYYSSAEFRAEQLQYQAQKGFTPISRFGIGLLSCFIVADRVEITSRHTVHAKAQSDSIRLSLSGLHGFFTLQTGNHLPKPMPGARGDGPGYRAKPGTSIAVRLDPRKQHGPLDLDQVLRKYLLYPPVPVVFRGTEIGGDPGSLQSSWLDHPIHVILSERQIAPFVERLAADPNTRISLRISPVDLSSNSPATGKLAGQAVIIHLHIENGLDELEMRAGISRDYELEVTEGALKVVSTVRIIGELDAKITSAFPDDRVARLKALAQQGARGVSTETDLSDTWEQVRAAVRAMFTDDESRIDLGHNGIFIDAAGPDDREVFNLDRPALQFGRLDVRTAGVIMLSDELRPELSVSRESLRLLPWNVCLALELAYRRATRESGVVMPELLRDGLPSLQQTILAEVLDEPLLARDGPWSREPVFRAEDNRLPPLTGSELRALYDQTGPASVVLARDYGYLRTDNWSTTELAERVFLQREFVSLLHLYSSRDARIHVTGCAGNPSRRESCSSRRLRSFPSRTPAFSATPCTASSMPCTRSASGCSTPHRDCRNASRDS